MKGNSMDLLWRIVSALTLDCLRSAQKPSPTCAASVESSSLSGSLSLGSDPPHCQWCISFDVRLKRLSCGHLFCDLCLHRIVNLAFEDIEGLSDYPCPVCKSIRQLGGLISTPCSLATPLVTPSGTMQRPAVKEEGRGR